MWQVIVTSNAEVSFEDSLNIVGSHGKKITSFSAVVSSFFAPDRLPGLVKSVNMLANEKRRFVF